MPLWLAVVLLLLALGGIVLCRRYLRHNRPAQALCIVVCALVALACAVYIGLTVLLVAAVQNRPPTLGGRHKAADDAPFSTEKPPVRLSNRRLFRIALGSAR